MKTGSSCLVPLTCVGCAAASLDLLIRSSAAFVLATQHTIDVRQESSHNFDGKHNKTTIKPKQNSKD